MYQFCKLAWELGNLNNNGQVDNIHAQTSGNLNCYEMSYISIMIRKV